MRSSFSTSRRRAAANGKNSRSVEQLVEWVRVREDGAGKSAVVFALNSQAGEMRQIPGSAREGKGAGDERKNYTTTHGQWKATPAGLCILSWLKN